MPETAIVILHYGDSYLANRCIDSIHKYTPKGTYHIVVVDNNSPLPFTRFDSEFPQIATEDNTITIVKNINHYSVDGMNVGFFTSLFRLNFQPKYIVNFDNDIECLPGWYEPLVKEMEDNIQTGICAGKQWNQSRTIHREVGLDLMGVLFANYPETIENVAWIQGSFVMIRADMMRLIGLHDTRYKIICSDSDYCLHARDRGWNVVFVPDSEVIHIGSASYGQKPTDFDRQDKTRFIQKWFGIHFYNNHKDFPISSKLQTYPVLNFDTEVRENTKKVIML